MLYRNVHHDDVRIVGEPRDAPHRGPASGASRVRRFGRRVQRTAFGEEHGAAVEQAPEARDAARERRRAGPQRGSDSFDPMRRGKRSRRVPRRFASEGHRACEGRECRASAPRRAPISSIADAGGLFSGSSVEMDAVCGVSPSPCARGSDGSGAEDARHGRRRPTLRRSGLREVSSGGHAVDWCLGVGALHAEIALTCSRARTQPPRNGGGCARSRNCRSRFRTVSS